MVRCEILCVKATLSSEILELLKLALYLMIFKYCFIPCILPKDLKITHLLEICLIGLLISEMCHIAYYLMHLAEFQVNLDQNIFIESRGTNYFKF